MIVSCRLPVDYRARGILRRDRRDSGSGWEMSVRTIVEVQSHVIDAIGGFASNDREDS